MARAHILSAAFAALLLSLNLLSAVTVAQSSVSRSGVVLGAVAMLRAVRYSRAQEEDEEDGLYEDAPPQAGAQQGGAGSEENISPEEAAEPCRNELQAAMMTPPEQQTQDQIGEDCRAEIQRAVSEYLGAEAAAKGGPAPDGSVPVQQEAPAAPAEPTGSSLPILLTVLLFFGAVFAGVGAFAYYRKVQYDAYLAANPDVARKLAEKAERAKRDTPKNRRKAAKAQN